MTTSENQLGLHRFIKSLISSSVPADVLKNNPYTFWVDWREFADDVIRNCEKLLVTGKLSAEILRTAEQEDLVITYGEKRPGRE